MTQKEKSKEKDGKLKIILLYMIEFALISELYVVYIDPFWGYSGFDFNPNIYKMAAAVAAIIAFVLLIPSRTTVRGFYLNLLVSTYFVPSMVLYCYANEPTSAAIVIWGGFAILYMASAIPIPRLTIIGCSERTLLRTLGVAVVCIIAAYPLLGGFTNFNLDITKVYDFRREAAQALPGVFGYLSPIFAKVVIPFCIAVALAQKHRGTAALFLILSIIQFGFTNNKGDLVTPFIIIIVYYFINYYNRYSIILILVIFSLILSFLISLMPNLIDGISIFDWYNSLLVRRVLMVPPLLDYMYIDFFSNNVYYYWSSSKITLGLLSIPYNGIAAPFVIGEAYFNSLETSANTGFIGSGYAQAGFYGVALYSFSAGVVIGFFERYGKDMGLPFTISATIILVSSFTASDFLTLFITHGLAVLIFLLMLVRPTTAIHSKGTRSGDWKRILVARPSISS